MHSRAANETKSPQGHGSYGQTDLLDRINERSAVKPILIVVVARKHNKRFPGKHEEILAGHLVIYYALEFAYELWRDLRDADFDVQAVFSSDLEYIGTLRKLRRPASLARDDTTLTDVLRHVCEEMHFDDGWIVLLQGNVPVRSRASVLEALMLAADGFDAVYTSYNGRPNGGVYVLNRRRLDRQEHDDVFFNNAIAIPEYRWETVELDWPEDLERAKLAMFLQPLARPESEA